MKNLRIAFAVLAAAALSASSAQADYRLCGLKVTKEASKLFKQFDLRFQKCADFGRKHGVENGDFDKAAGLCEKQLNKLYGLTSGTSYSKTFIGKFEGKIDGLVSKTQCEAADLASLGHLVSPAQAPGTNPQDFMITWLVKAKEMLAFKENLFDAADTRDLIQEMADESGCDTAMPTRPNVCHVAESVPQCRTHVCTLSSTTGDSQAGIATSNVLAPFIPVPASGGFPFEVCKLHDVSDFPPTGITPANYFLIINQPARSLKVATILGNTICIDQLRSQGYCACTAVGTPAVRDITFCQDHTSATSGADDCSGTPFTTAGLESCECASPAAATCGAGCTSCVDSADGATRCHPGTVNGAVETTFATALGVGDCVDINTLALKVIGAGEQGSDGVPCTEDDTAPPLASVSIPFTTGTATAQVMDADRADGSCSGGTTPGMNCLTSADCLGGGTCTGALILDISASQSGVPVSSCENLEASNLSGTKIVGGFPTLDVDFGGGIQADLAVAFALTCE